MRASWLWPLIISTSGIVLMVLVLSNVQSPARVVIAVGFLMVCPGMAFVRLLDIGQSLIEWTLAVGLSIALVTLVAGVMIYAGVYTVERTLLLMILVTTIGVVLQIIALIRDEVEM